MFKFVGELELSKSWLNRMLILNSFSQTISFRGSSSADDCCLLDQALQEFKDGKNHFNAGKGGTTFRFLAFRISRIKGNYKVALDESLLKRPLDDLIQILEQLGVKSYLNSKNEFEIHSQGWCDTKEYIQINSNKSSQFLSGLLLSSIECPFDIKIKINRPIASESYFEYTLKLLNQVGVQYAINKNENELMIEIKKNQFIKIDELQSELDISSAFTICSAAVLSGEVQITNWNKESNQPDKVFLKYFDMMNISYIENNNLFSIQKANKYKAIEVNLQNAPDLFPVLAVLCSFAEGISYLFGADQLIYKESNRLEKTIELLNKCQVKIEVVENGIKIHGDPNRTYYKKDLILFDTASDHRMAFAAALFILKKYPIKMNDPKVISKSYPQFYEHIGLNLLRDLN